MMNHTDLNLRIIQHHNRVGRINRGAWLDPSRTTSRTSLSTIAPTSNRVSRTMAALLRIARFRVQQPTYVNR